MLYITGDIHGSLEPIYDFIDYYDPTTADVIVLLGMWALIIWERSET